MEFNFLIQVEKQRNICSLFVPFCGVDENADQGIRFISHCSYIQTCFLNFLLPTDYS